MGLLKRIRGALGIGALGAIGFHLIGWLIVGVEALFAGTLPTTSLIARMSVFTLSVGGFVGLLTAGAITLGARSSGLFTKGRVFLLGLSLGAAGGLLLSLSAGGLPVFSLVVNTVTFALATGALGVGAVTVAGISDDRTLDADPRHAELPEAPE